MCYIDEHICGWSSGCKIQEKSVFSGLSGLMTNPGIFSLRTSLHRGFTSGTQTQGPGGGPLHPSDLQFIMGEDRMSMGSVVKFFFRAMEAPL